MDKLAVAGPTLPPAEDINLEHSYATTFSEDDEYYRLKNKTYSSLFSFIAFETYIISFFPSGIWI